MTGTLPGLHGPQTGFAPQHERAVIDFEHKPSQSVTGLFWIPANRFGELPSLVPSPSQILTVSFANGHADIPLSNMDVLAFETRPGPFP